MCCLLCILYYICNLYDNVAHQTTEKIRSCDMVLFSVCWVSKCCFSFCRCYFFEFFFLSLLNICLFVILIISYCFPQFSLMLRHRLIIFFVFCYCYWLVLCFAIFQNVSLLFFVVVFLWGENLFIYFYTFYLQWRSFLFLCE